MYWWSQHAGVVAAVLLASGLLGRQSAAAPALKTGDPSTGGVVDFAAVHALVAKAVEGGKLSPADERRVLDTMRRLQATLRKAAELTTTSLPVEPEGLGRAEVAKTVRQANVQKAIVVAGDVEGTVARDSIILASGNVKFTVLERCVVMGQSVRFTTATNCLITAAEIVHGTGVRPGTGENSESVILAGKWLRATGVSGAVCYILRPGDETAPDDPKGLPAKAVRLNQAKGVIFLNRREDVAATGTSECRWVELESPAVK